MRNYGRVDDRRRVGVPTSTLPYLHTPIRPYARSPSLDACSGRDDSSLWDADDAVTNVEAVAIQLLGALGRFDDHTISNTRVLVDDSALDLNIFTDPEVGDARPQVFGNVFRSLVIVVSHHDGVSND